MGSPFERFSSLVGGFCGSRDSPSTAVYTVGLVIAEAPQVCQEMRYEICPFAVAAGIDCEARLRRSFWMTAR